MNNIKKTILKSSFELSCLIVGFKICKLFYNFTKDKHKALDKEYEEYKKTLLTEAKLVDCTLHDITEMCTSAINRSIVKDSTDRTEYYTLILNKLINDYAIIFNGGRVRNFDLQTNKNILKNNVEIFKEELTVINSEKPNVAEDYINSYVYNVKKKEEKINGIKKEILEKDIRDREYQLSLEKIKSNEKGIKACVSGVVGVANAITKINKKGE